MPVTTAVISGVLKGAPLLVNLFEGGGDVEGFGSADDLVRDALVQDGVGLASDRGETLPAPVETSPLPLRELEVLRLVALGWDTRHIAARLGISRHTVRNHIRNLRDKLGASTKLDAVLRSPRLGIISVGGSPQ